MEREISVLIIDKKASRRDKLRQTLTTLPERYKVRIAQSLQDSTKITAKESFDFVFVSSELSSFCSINIFDPKSQVQSEKQTKYIVILSGTDLTKAAMAQNYAQGADGFLAAPYSADDIQAVLQALEQNPRKDWNSRRADAMNYLVQSETSLIDKLATNKLRTGKVGAVLNSLREQGDALSTIVADDIERYADTLVQKLENAPVPQEHASLRQRKEEELAAEKAQEEADAAAAKEKAEKAKASKGAGPRVIHRSS